MFFDNVVSKLYFEKITNEIFGCMIPLKNKLSLKIFILTGILLVMTIIVMFTGISTLQHFKQEYQHVKDNHIKRMLDISNLNRYTYQILSISSDMFIAKDAKELRIERDTIEVKLDQATEVFERLYANQAANNEDVEIKKQLSVQTSTIYNSVLKKIELSDRFFIQYERAYHYKQLLVAQNNERGAIIVDKALSYFNPLINESHKKIDVASFKMYIASVKSLLPEKEYSKLTELFTDEKSLISAYERQIVLLRIIDELTAVNDKLSKHVLAVSKKNTSLIQEQLLESIKSVDKKISDRRLLLYFMILICGFTALLLFLLLLNLFHRVRLIKKVIDEGYTQSLHDIPITGNDEFSMMARSVKNFIERLLTKESEARDSNIKLEHLATHDDLTETYNRRYFNERFEYEHELYQRYKSPYCLAIFDLDYFKQVNDRYGHDIGDKVLVDFTGRIYDKIRKTDMFARIGGEEFALLMPHTTEDNALVLLNRIIENIRSTPCVHGDVEVNFTVSIGLLQVQELDDMTDVSLQLKLADAALYEAKHTGRDRICVYRNKLLTNEVT